MDVEMHDHVKSTVIANNQNHFLKLFEYVIESSNFIPIQIRDGFLTFIDTLVSSITSAVMDEVDKRTDLKYDLMGKKFTGDLEELGRAICGGCPTYDVKDLLLMLQEKNPSFLSVPPGICTEEYYDFLKWVSHKCQSFLYCNHMDEYCRDKAVLDLISKERYRP